jgi:phage virion morphogenesis protein
MGCRTVNDLSAVEAWAGALLKQLSPASRRAATREIARELRRSQQTRIGAQKNPDRTGYEPRKVRSGGKKLRGKRGRLKRAAMFAKLRNSRWMLIEGNDSGLTVGFAGRVARLARVHQFGEKAAVAPGGPQYRYPSRVLLGLTDAEHEMVRDRLLRHLDV